MKPENLEKGKLYFTIWYLHPKYPIPEIKTYVYLGKNINGEPENGSLNEYVFQIPQKYFEEDILLALPDSEKEEFKGTGEPTDFIVREDTLDAVEDLHGLIKRLKLIEEDKTFIKLFRSNIN